MYEYRITPITNIYDTRLIAPDGFRLRDVKVVEMGRSVNSYGTGTTESVSHTGFAIWEKYVSEDSNDA